VARVAIVLATYDGGAHLDAQLASLRSQSFADWKLLVRDDGSTDGTYERLAAAARVDSRITLLERGPRLGVVRNFGELLAHAHAAGAEYVFPCDQDDVWLPSRVARALAVMDLLEGQHGRDTPTLVHSDLQVVDEQCRLIHPSFLRRQGIRHEARNPLDVLLVQNFVTGCAALLNRPLLELALPVPGGCIMHDWWIAQCAAASGRIGFVPEATVLYRQHRGNHVGAAGALGGLNPLRPQGRRRLAQTWGMAERTLEQARLLHDRLRQRDAAAEEVLARIDGYARARAVSGVERLRLLRRLGVHRQRPFGTAAMYVMMSLLGRTPA
jgi:hypothetical protein